MEQRKILIGRKEIAAYTGRSWPTVKTWVKEYHFPARMLEGRWASKSDMIDVWLQERIELADMTSK